MTSYTITILFIVSLCVKIDFFMNYLLNDTNDIFWIKNMTLITCDDDDKPMFNFIMY